MQIPISHIIYKNHPIDILRLDSLSHEIKGNKYFKLKYNLDEAKTLNKKTLLTYGGAFSNHLHAVAQAGNHFGFHTVGIVRGEDDLHNPTLQFCRKNNMQLHFISRQAYKNKESNSFESELIQQFGDCYIIPEGGTNALAIKGCSEICLGFQNKYDYIFCAAGTGGTIAGIIDTKEITAQIIGISVLKGNDVITKKIETSLFSQNKNWKINFDYHFGGYAKYHPQLLQFINQFQTQYAILLDPIYTAKVLFAIFDLIDQKKILPHQHILALHTGGLQGWDGWNYRFKK